MAELGEKRTHFRGLLAELGEKRTYFRGLLAELRRKEQILGVYWLNWGEKYKF